MSNNKHKIKFNWYRIMKKFLVLENSVLKQKIKIIILTIVPSIKVGTWN